MSEHPGIYELIDGDGTPGNTQVTSLTIHGFFDIQIKLVNNAFVIADEGTTTSLLSTYTKSGNDGVWEAEGNATLKVNIGVSGGADWNLTTDADAEIWFNVACTGLTDDVWITNGTLDIDQNFDTTGSLGFESTGGSHPRIEVASGKTAEFD